MKIYPSEMPRDILEKGDRHLLNTEFATDISERIKARLIKLSEFDATTIENLSNIETPEVIVVDEIIEPSEERETEINEKTVRDKGYDLLNAVAEKQLLRTILKDEVFEPDDVLARALQFALGDEGMAFPTEFLDILTKCYLSGDSQKLDDWLKTDANKTMITNADDFAKFLGAKIVEREEQNPDFEYGEILCMNKDSKIYLNPRLVTKDKSNLKLAIGAATTALASTILLFPTIAINFPPKVALTLAVIEASVGTYLGYRSHNNYIDQEAEREDLLKSALTQGMISHMCTNPNNGKRGLGRNS